MTSPPPKRPANSDIITDIPFLHTAKRLKVEARKLDGLQRELYSLIGENPAPIATTPTNKFKTRPEWQQKAVPWKLTDFEPKPGLVLQHWVRSASLVDGVSTYQFGKYSTPLKIPKWTDEDYQNFSSDEWTLEETRYLFDLAEEFELRWIVIADRYNYQNNNNDNNSKPRTLEDLKERYYEVCIALIKTSPTVLELGLSPQDQQQIDAMTFPKETEQQRKEHLQQLLSRSPKDVAEEEALILEARRLESMSTQMITERKALIDYLEAPSMLNTRGTKADLNTSAGVSQLMTELQTERDRRPQQSATPPTKSEIENMSPMVAKLVQGKFSDREMQAYGIRYLDPNVQKHAGVYLRSAKLTPIRQSLLPKYRAVLQELELPLKPTMPTKKACALYDVVYQDIGALLEAKKVQDKLEMEIEVLKKANSK